MEMQLVSSLRAADSGPATARAYRTLERMIVTLELAPGSVATEATLIERVGLGRTPVREALQRLAWEGLVEVRPRAGVAVAPLARRGLAARARRALRRRKDPRPLGRAAGDRRGGRTVPCGRARHAKGRHHRQCRRLPRGRQGARRSDSGHGRQRRSRPALRRRCRPTAAASGFATRATPAWPPRPSATLP